MRQSTLLLAATVLAVFACGRLGRRDNPTPLASRVALLRDPTHAEWRAPAPALSQLRFETSKGVFVLELMARQLVVELVLVDQSFGQQIHHHGKSIP